MGKFEIKKDASGQFRFNLKATNGQVILSSEAYRQKPSCVNGIESVRKNSQDDANYDRKDADGKYRFKLRATNTLIIGVSESYNTSEAMENGIASVKKNAPDADLEDNS